jgi:hypothetical protein
MNKTLPSKFFNRLTAFITGAKVHDSNCGYKGYRKKVVKKLQLYKGFHRYIPAIVKRQGFKIGEIKVTHHPRTHGVSKYKTERLFKGMVDLVMLNRIYPNKKKRIQIIWPAAFIVIIFGIIIGIISGISNGFSGLFENGNTVLPLSMGLIIFGFELFSIGILIRNTIFEKIKEQKFILKKV